MNHSIATIGASLLCIGALTAAPPAQAQDARSTARPSEGPSNALEVKVGTAYTQGFGQLTPTQSVGDTAGGGVAVALDIDYRMAQRWSVGAQAEYAELGPHNDNASRAFASNAGVTFHVRPQSNGDPWFRLGSGYRILWSVDDHTTGTYGFQLAKATLGYDFRVDPQVAFAPIVGADVDLFAWQSGPNVRTTMPSAQVGTFIFAGLQGRFDVAAKGAPPSVTQPEASAR
jgi:hypothetical protein